MYNGGGCISAIFHPIDTKIRASDPLDHLNILRIRGLPYKF